MTQLPSLKILTTKKEFRDMATNAMVKEFNQRLKLREGLIQADIRKMVREALKNTATYKSLVGGNSGRFSLMAHFGLPFSQAATMVNNIIDLIVEDIKFPSPSDSRSASGFFFVVNGKPKGTFRISIEIDYPTLITSPDASYISFPSGEKITWLAWLLDGGIQPIIMDFGIEFDTFPPTRSRSTQAVMTDLDENPKLKAWRVPPQYGGTIQSGNWLTKTLGNPIVGNRMLRIIKKALK